MADESVRDGADDRARPPAELPVENVFQPHHAGRAVLVALVVHAVVGGERHGRAQLLEPAEARIHFRIEAVGLPVPRRIGVLDIVGEREVEDIRAALLEQLQPRIEHEEGKVRRIHVRQRLADKAERVLDAVLLHGAAVGMLRGEADRAVREVHALLELAAELVLGGDGGDPQAGARELAHHRVDLKQFGAGHHHRLVRRAVQVEIAGDAVHRGRAAGDDGHVVGAGEARHGALCHRVEAVPHVAGDVGQDPRLEAVLDIGRVAAVDAHHDQRPRRPAVLGAVHFQSVCCHVATPSPPGISRLRAPPCSRGRRR